MFGGQLRDAFNRDVFPNTGQPGSYGVGNGGPSSAFSGGSTMAYEAASPFGNVAMGGGGGGSFGNVANYQGGGGSFNNEIGPNYQMNGSGYGGASGYGDASGGGGLANYESCEPCNIPGNGYGSGAGNDYGYGGQGAGNGASYGSSYDAGSGFSGGPNSPDINYNNDPGYGAQTGYNTSYNALSQRNSHLSATHASVNEMLVKYLRDTVVKISKALKVKPDWVDLSPDGGASWKYSSMVQGNSLWCRVFTKVEVDAERKGFKRPLPHICNITTTTKIKLDPELVSELQKEFPMMSYCPSTNTLKITMDSLEHNLAMLSLICSCQQDKISLDNIKYYNLPKKYMLLTTPGNRRYNPGAKYSLVRQIRS